MLQEPESILTPDQVLLARDFLNPPTNIDRWTCTRVVPMKILCLGQSRTGTQSLRAALFELGYSDIYHMTSVFRQNPRDGEMWIDAFEAKFKGRGDAFGKEEWDCLLGHCMVAMDSPVNSFSEDVLAAYPDSKVILSVRDSVDVWYKSCYDTISPVVQEHYLSWWRRLILPKPYFRDFLDRVYGNTYWRDFPRLGKQAYIEENEIIRRLVPKEKLLEYNVKEGWAPLCKFLGKDIPDEPFPRRNDTAEFNALMAYLRVLQYQELWGNVRKVLAGLAGVGAVALGVYLARRSGFGTKMQQKFMQ